MGGPKDLLKVDIVQDPSSSDLIFEALIREASVLPGDASDITRPIATAKEGIPWYDPELVKAGQAFVHRHWFAVFFAHFMSLIIGAALKPGTAVLIRTGLSHKKEHSLLRYLSTSAHVQLWYDGDFGEVIKDVQKVRRLHAKAIRTYYDVPLPAVELSPEGGRILEAVREDVAAVPVLHQVPGDLLTYEPEVPLSQLAMVMTQFSFMGFLVLFPAVFGVHDTEGLSGFCHIWAVLGKLIGIQDRFNLGLHSNVHVLRRLFNEISLPGLKTADELTMAFWESVVEGVATYRGPTTLNAILLFMVQDMVGVKDGRRLKKLMSWYDRYCYQMLHWTCSYFLRIRMVRWMVNKHAKYCIWMAKWRYM